MHTVSSFSILFDFIVEFSATPNFHLAALHEAMFDEAEEPFCMQVIYSLGRYHADCAFELGCILGRRSQERAICYRHLNQDCSFGQNPPGCWRSIRLCGEHLPKAYCTSHGQVSLWHQHGLRHDLGKCHYESERCNQGFPQHLRHQGHLL